MALGQIQLKQINQAQLSGYVAQVAATGVVIRPEETGGFIDVSTMNNSGTLLWNRDLALSGLLGNATGNININLGQTGQTLFNRETELSNNIAAISGSNDAGASGQTLWLRDEGLSTNLVALSGGLGVSGQTLWIRDTNLSSNIAALSGIAITSSQTGGFLTQSDSGNFITSAIVYSLSGNLVATGSVFNSTGLNLFNRDIGLSENIAALSGVSITTSETGLFLTQADSGNFLRLSDSGNLGGGGDLTHASGSLLFDRDTELSDNLADISGLIGGGGTTLNGIDGNIQITGTGQIFVFANGASKILTISGSGLGVGDVTTEEIESLSGDLHQTGIISWGRESELSSNIAELSGITVTTSDTGLFLTQSDSGNFLRLSDSGNLGGGGDLTHASGSLLWNRDEGLSAELALVSGIAESAGGGGGSSSAAGSTKTVVRFHATKDYITPETGWASPYYATGYEFVRFRDGAVDGEKALYNGIIPEGIDLNVGLNVTLFWHPSTDNTDDVAWVTDFQKVGSLALDNWGTPVTTIASATGSHEWVHKTTIHHAAGAEIGNIQSGDSFMFRVIRSGLLAGDTMSDYANLQAIHIESPVSRTITKTFDRFAAVNFTTPTTGYAQIDYISGVRTMQLHPDSGEAGMFDSIIPENIDLSNGIRVGLHWFPEESDTNDVAFITAFGQRDLIGNDAFGTEKTTIATSTGAGRLHKTFVEHSSAEIGGLISGDFYRLKVGRSGTLGGDTMAGNAHITQIELDTR